MLRPTVHHAVICTIALGFGAILFMAPYAGALIVRTLKALQVAASIFTVLEYFWVPGLKIAWGPAGECWIKRFFPGTRQAYLAFGGVVIVFLIETGRTIGLHSSEIISGIGDVGIGVCFLLLLHYNGELKRHPHRMFLCVGFACYIIAASVHFLMVI
jgi:hypothetical protein